MATVHLRSVVATPRNGPASGMDRPATGEHSNQCPQETATQHDHQQRDAQPWRCQQWQVRQSQPMSIGSASDTPTAEGHVRCPGWP
jgi:hypothetical protein